MKKLLVETAIVVHPQGSKLLESTGMKGYLVESDEKSGRLRVRLPATTLDKKNENGRVYSLSVMENTMRKTREMFESKRLLSSVNEHPEEPYVTPGEASHIVVDAWCENGYLYNEWEILDTHNGKNLRALIEAGASFGVSIRGLGSVDNYGQILDDYEYLGTDCVGQPSARIWTAPTKVDEGGSKPSSTSSAKTESLHEGKTTMKTKDEALKYVKEQSILMKSESVLEALQRLIVVESTLAGSTVAPRDLVTAYAELDKIKAEIVPSTTAPASAGRLAESKDGDKTEADKLRAQLETLNRTMREQITKMADTFKRSQDALKASVAESTRRLDIAEKGVKFYKKRADESAAKLAEARKQLVESNVKYRAAVHRAAKAAAGYTIARGVAVENAMKYNVLLKTAAKHIRESKPAKPAKPAAATAAPAATPAKVVKTNVIESKPTTRPSSTRNQTAANRAGTTRIPGFI